MMVFISTSNPVMTVFSSYLILVSNSYSNVGILSLEVLIGMQIISLLSPVLNAVVSNDGTCFG